jgi:Fe-S oxidoreductase
MVTKNMKILFIYPNAGSQLGFQYGLAYMSAELKEAGHAVELWQLCEDIAPLPPREEFINRVKEIKPDIVGFSVVTNQWPYTRELAAWAREATSAPLVCGGIHATVAGEDVLQTGLFDYIFRGEAETAFLEFVEKMARKEDVAELRNLGLNQNGAMRINPVRPLPDLKKLPFKDYDIFDFQKIIDAKNGWVGLMASRGCPFSCTYCFNHEMVKQYRKDLNCSFKELNYIRHFDVKQMISEIEYLLDNYRNIKMFIFDDDLFTFHKEYIKKFCEAYKSVSSIPFVVNAHVDFFDEERARSLRDANCKIVKFGVESGSERIRSHILNRHMKNKKIIESIKTAHKFGLHTSVFLMIGLPGETREDVMDTIRLMGEAGPGRFRWTFFFPSRVPELIN